VTDGFSAARPPGGPTLTRRRTLALLAALGGAAVLAPGCATATGAPPSRPWPQRPRVDLSFDVADDLRTVSGRERVVFTPDQDVTELVFRAWPNRPSGARSGTSLTVDGATVDGAPAPLRVVSAGAPPGAPGTLVEIPLPGRVPAGRAVTVDLGFSLVLGADADERFGSSPSTRTAWFATGFPLLAWVRGQGWARDDAVALPGETSTSEQMALASLTVVAPSGDAVAGTGTALGTSPGPRPGTTAHRFTADAVRDVAVSVGRFAVLEEDLGSTRLHLFTPLAGARLPPEDWAQALGDGLDALTPQLGAFPYPDLWVTVVPSQSSGIEFPGALQFGDVGPGRVFPLAAHELAHQWFYGLVGNNQARHPWLDESFATFAEAVAVGSEGDFALEDIADEVAGDLGAPMAEWASRGGFGLYYEGVYRQGAAVLLEARRRAGAERFDTALGAYLAIHAHRVAAPTDVAAAFRDVPEAIGLLNEYGALPSRS
jgi:hypothetical protein